MVSRRETSGSLTVAEVLAKAFPSSGGAPGRIDIQVCVIPQGTEPRWIVIGDPKPAATMLSSWRPFKISTRLRWSAVVKASALGALSRLPGVIGSRVPINFLYWRQRLAGFEPGRTLVLHVGNPSHSRKATIFSAPIGNAARLRRSRSARVEGRPFLMKPKSWGSWAKVFTIPGPFFGMKTAASLPRRGSRASPSAGR